MASIFSCMAATSLEHPQVGDVEGGAGGPTVAAPTLFSTQKAARNLNTRVPLILVSDAFFLIFWCERVSSSSVAPQAVLVRPGLSLACFSCSLVGGAFFRYEKLNSLRSGAVELDERGAFFWGEASTLPSGVVLGEISVDSFWSEGSSCTLSMRTAAEHELGESMSSGGARNGGMWWVPQGRQG